MNIRKEKLDMFQAVYAALRPRLEVILTEEQRIILTHLSRREQRSDGDS